MTSYLPEKRQNINFAHLPYFQYIGRFYLAHLVQISLLIITTFMFLMVSSTPVLAASSDVINFQSRIVNLTDGTNLSSGSPSCIVGGADTCDFRASIYSDSAGGTLLWQETHSNVELGDTNGIFNLELNSVCADWSGGCAGSGITWGSDSTIYVQLEFDPDGDADFAEGETFSRKLLTSVPYAYYADSAGSIAGIDETGFVQLQPSTAQVATGTDPLIYLNETGGSTPNLLQLQVGGTDVFTVTNSGGIQLGASANEIISQASTGAGATNDLYYGNDLLCDVSEADCGWATAAEASLFTDDTGFTYLTQTADDLLVGGTTIAGADIILGDNGATVFNEQGNAVDFRIETDTNANLFFVDGSADRVGFGGAPSYPFHITNALDSNDGTVGGAYEPLINDTGAATNYGMLFRPEFSNTSATQYRSLDIRTEIETGATNTANIYTIHVDAPTFTASSSVNHIYGLYLSDLNSNGGIDGRTYGVYQFGSDNWNYFGGSVGIGDTTPDAPLDVVGDVYISDGLSLYETAVSNGTVEATQFCTGDGETNCITDFSSVINGAGLWTDGSGFTYRTDIADDVLVGGTTIAGADIILGDNGATVFNEQGNAVDFRIEGDTEANLFVVDGSADRVGIADSTPSYLLDIGAASNTDGIALNGDLAFSSNDSYLRVNQNLSFASGIYSPGALRIDGGVVFNDNATAVDFRVEGDLLTHALFVDGSNDSVFIGASAETISHVGFITNSSDLFVAGQLGVEGDIFTDGDLYIDEYINFDAGTTEYIRWDSVNSQFLITDDLVPNVGATYDLGSDSNRWLSTYFGSGTLYLGDSGTDQATIQYDPISGKLKIDTDATANADIAIFTNDLYLDKSDSEVGFGTTNPSAKVHTYETFTNPGALDRSVYHQIFLNTTGTNNNNIYGQEVDLRANPSTGTTKGGVVIASKIRGFTTDAGTITTFEGVRGTVQNAGTGTITSARGLYAGVDLTTGTITNAYGLYVGAVEGTNEWGIYQSDASNDNYFAGQVGIGRTSPIYSLDVNGTVRLDLSGSTTTNAICHTGGATATNDVVLTDCNGSASDVAEWYVAQNNVVAGDIVSLSNNTFGYTAEGADPVTGLIYELGAETTNVLEKGADGSTLIGIVSTAPWQTIGEDVKRAVDDSGDVSITAVPLALKGRVPVNVASDSPSIAPGDSVTISTTQNGKAMKASPGDQIVGRALESWTNGSGVAQILVYVADGYHEPGFSSAVTWEQFELQNGQNLFELQDNGADEILTLNVDELIIPGSVTIQQDLDVAGKITATGIQVTNATVAGLFKATGDIAAPANAGNAIITTGNTTVAVPNTNVKADSSINITPHEFVNYRVTAINPGVGFTIEIDLAQGKDVEFSYSVINISF